ncbi:ABC transporter ATP-binding protein [Priestia aryabhattai]|uniref:ABC transporter ATP-binding protein n=1 Tax=Priestia TaxID=2800373 RepID=UPI0013F66582|nr:MULTISPECIES: ABC transporter ATP-binding protein [Priestia]NHH96079.1 putative ABC transporter ATP-binding protein YxlF [Bacillus sp. MB95]MEB4856020.1 ABC transporter ATP-binding protein [Priestia megaterium]MED3923180.1 ABC transporter ATP-binding protein [Priestia aryabhattai]MED3957208.1 ABC transporter ATP-binding protein [Priestia aryabhattai]MED4005899.1 ABC transporter ATP-binding protein [Priestia aryabhattai]
MYVLKDISKRYKQHVALAPLSFQVSKGECLVLCGGNGAGKSTLIDILAGISMPSSGAVTLEEDSLIDHRKQYLTNISYMPDDFHAQRYLTVREFLLFYGSLRSVSKDKVNKVLDTIGLQEKQYAKVKELSKGMRQRLLLGQALLPEAKVILLDEPTNGLDPYWINQFIQIIKEAKKNGTIIIFSTHMMDVAAELGDEIMFLDNGHVVKQLKNYYLNIPEFTLKLLSLHRQLKRSD